MEINQTQIVGTDFSKIAFLLKDCAGETYFVDENFVHLKKSGEYVNRNIPNKSCWNQMMQKLSEYRQAVKTLRCYKKRSR